MPSSFIPNVQYDRRFRPRRAAARFETYESMLLLAASLRYIRDLLCGNPCGPIGCFNQDVDVSFVVLDIHSCRDSTEHTAILQVNRHRRDDAGPVDECDDLVEYGGIRHVCSSLSLLAYETTLLQQGRNDTKRNDKAKKPGNESLGHKKHETDDACR